MDLVDIHEQLEALVKALPEPACGLPVGLREDGEVYRLPLLGNHLLLIGETGSGKSSASGRSSTSSPPRLPTASSNSGASTPRRWSWPPGEPPFARHAYADPADYAHTGLGPNGAGRSPRRNAGSLAGCWTALKSPLRYPRVDACADQPVGA
jgi:hypothetical protein